MIKAVFFDIDGTLFSHKTFEVPKSTLRALKKLKEQGIFLFTATGRHLIMIEQLLGDRIPFDGYVSLTGQICLDGEKRIIYKNPIHQEDAEKIAAFFQSKKRPLTLIEENRRYINIENKRETASSPDAGLFPPVEEYQGGALYQAAGRFSRQEAEALLPHLTHCRFTQWDTDAIDIIPADGGKMIGIQKLSEYYHLTPDSIMAFGDGDNDVDMLEFAHIGVAMGNASPKAKAAADYVTADIDEDGIARALQHFSVIDTI